MGNIKVEQDNWEELGISNDFLFGKIMQNLELCKEFIAKDTGKIFIDKRGITKIFKSLIGGTGRYNKRLEKSR